MAKIFDLNSCPQPVTQASCDVCVIGAGAAGLYLASRLSRDGLHVIMLEAGGATCKSGAAVGIVPLFTGSQYGGALEGRAFGWGGTTSRWGGLLVPHSDSDLREDGTPESRTWKHIVSVVRDHSSAVFSTLALRGNPVFLSLPATALGETEKSLHARGFETVAAEFLPFRHRNLTYLASAGSSRNLIVYLNAVATKWFATSGSNESGSVSAVEATSQTTRSLRVSAKSFVIAAGAIESARILLEIDRSTKEQMFSRSARIGQYLSDHLSCTIAEVHPEDRNQAANMFGPIFRNGRMRSFRFLETSGELPASRHFFHFIFDIENAEFQLAKSLLLSLQTKALPDLRTASSIGGILGLSRLVWDRFIKARLYIPPYTAARLQMDIEQTPNLKNRVCLGEKTDQMGRPVAVVHWQIDELDYKNIRLLSHRFRKKWPGQSLGFPRLTPIHLGEALPKPYDAYHPVGTCKMGSDEEATVDFGLRVRGTKNLYVLSTGVLPSAGTANPTFSMLCLGDRLADQLAKLGGLNIGGGSV